MAACAVAAAPAAAASLPSNSTALLSGDSSLSEPFATPVGLAHIAPSAVSANGRYVAFASTSDGLLPGDDDRSFNIYRKDMETDEVVLVSRRSGANGAPSRGTCFDPAISDDGLRVAFACTQPLELTQDRGALVEEADAHIWRAGALLELCELERAETHVARYRAGGRGSPGRKSKPGGRRRVARSSRR